MNGRSSQVFLWAEIFTKFSPEVCCEPKTLNQYIFSEQIYKELGAIIKNLFENMFQGLSDFFYQNAPLCSIRTIINFLFVNFSTICQGSQDLERSPTHKRFFKGLL